ncbi:hypothetical protein FHW12_003728 [Dokdonella fugitiva]|uniref:Uncharacterized protein n=1 Tax=Dokdonella fugitiva TaxID=328517 RepID=A0A839F5Y8_9GAMM|nr:hypothetical protein [Dokdonella fugitiva]MBA8889482.1 hypothetical protein [Dokdonella fugitiva]
MAHEVVERLRERGLPLQAKLIEMLDEHPSHRTERRGCGYTQATRFLSTFVNRPASAQDASDLDVFADWPLRETGYLAAIMLASGWRPGWRRADAAPADVHAGVRQYGDVLDALRSLGPRLRAAAGGLERTESRLFAAMLRQVIERDATSIDAVAPMPCKPEIGSCSQAEEFFLELAHGRVRRGGSVNVVVGRAGIPVMIEKMNLGESHSAIVLESIALAGVDLPPGSLCALAHVAGASGAPTANGMRLPLDAIASARFLRLTTLAVAPVDRQRAFSAQFEAQLRSRMLSPASTTLDDLRAFAHGEAARAA